MLLMLLACSGNKDSGAAEGAFVWTGGDGSVVDYSAQAATGAAGSPATITIDQPGSLEIASGTWYVMLVLGADTTILGTGDTQPILSASGAGVVIDIVEPASVNVENLALTEGFGCLGQAIRAAKLTNCDRESVTPVAVTLTLKNLDIYNHTFDIGGGAVGVTNGSTVMIENSNIHGNDGHGIYGQMSDVFCKGSEEDHYGMWGNGKNGIWIEIFDESIHTIDSDLCDFGEGTEDNGHDDVGFGETLAADYGDNASFSCNSGTSTCQ